MAFAFLICSNCGLLHNYWYKSYMYYRQRLENICLREKLDIDELVEFNKIFCIKHNIKKMCCITMVLEYN
jgi:hypothetical protein